MGARMLLVLGAMGSGFLTVMAVERWDVADSVVGIYTAILLLGQTAGNLMAGLIADRVGHKLPLIIGGIAQVTGYTLAVLIASPAGMYAVYALIGLGVGINIVSGVLIALEFSTAERRPTYVGLANSTVGIASGLAPLLGGWIAGFGYPWLFGVGAVIGAAALIWLQFGVADPRHVPIYSGAASEPLGTP